MGLHPEILPKSEFMKFPGLFGVIFQAFCTVSCSKRLFCEIQVLLDSGRQEDLFKKAPGTIIYYRPLNLNISTMNLTANPTATAPKHAIVIGGQPGL